MKKNRAYLFFTIPALTLLGIFSILPIFLTIGISFTNLDLGGLRNFGQVDFVGLKNYITLFSTNDFTQVILNTFYYVFIGVPLVILFSLSAALAINFISGKLGNLFRGIYYLPAITNTIAIAFVWQLLYNKSFGIFNYILSLIGAGPIDWLGDPTYAKFSLIILAVWKGIGLNMIILLAGLTAIPKDYYEAASIDGAGAVKKFFKITLPQLKFALFFVIVTTTIGWMQFFDEIYVLDIKDTANAKSIALYIYEIAFQNPNQYGLGAAASVILFIIIIGITIFQLGVQRRGDR